MSTAEPSTDLVPVSDAPLVPTELAPRHVVDEAASETVALCHASVPGVPDALQDHLLVVRRV